MTSQSSEAFEMARPRVFVSSTYFDLKDLRSSLDQFIKTLGFEAVLSEKGNIAYLLTCLLTSLATER
jgi:hypothetical protein